MTAYSLSVRGHPLLTVALAAIGALLFLSAFANFPGKNKAVAVSPLTVLLIVALAASLLVAKISQEQPNPPRVEIGPILLWLAALVVVVSALVILALRDGAFGFMQLCKSNAEALAVLGICTAGLVVRVIDLTKLPWPFSGDEAQFLIQAGRVGQGEIRNVFASGYQGHPNLFWWALYGTTRLFGDSVWGARMFGVVVGTATTGAIYFLLRALFSRTAGLLGAAYFSAYHFPLQYSRQDMNNICDALTTTLVVFFLWRALTFQKNRDYVAAGLLSGLGLYMYAGARAIAVILALVLILSFVFQFQRCLQVVRGAAYLGVSLAVAAAPLGLFWFDHPDEFSNRINQIGIYQSGWLRSEEAKTGKGEFTILLTQAKNAFGAFGILSDRSPFYRGPMPLVDHLSLAFFLIGGCVAILHFSQPRYLILIITFVAVVATGGVLTIEPPQSQRLLSTAPVVTAFVVDGVLLVASLVSRTKAARWFRRQNLSSQGLTAFLASAVILALGIYNLRYYFHDYRQGDYYSDFNTRIAWAAGQMASNSPRETTVYWEGAPFIYVGHPSFEWQVRERIVHDVLDDGKIVPPLTSLPRGPAILMAVEGRQADFDKALSVCPLGRERTAQDREGRTLFLVLEVDDSTCLASTLGAPPPSQ